MKQIKMKQIKMKQICQTLVRFIKIRSDVRFIKRSKGEGIHYKDQNFSIFRAVHIDKVKQDNSVVLCLRFRFHLNVLWIDRIFSFTQIPFFVGMSGFQGKLWTFDRENKRFQGFYQWESEFHAEQYLNSYAVQIVKKRAKGHEVDFDIIRQMNLDTFINQYSTGSK